MHCINGKSFSASILSSLSSLAHGHGPPPPRLSRTGSSPARPACTTPPLGSAHSAWPQPASLSPSPFPRWHDSPTYHHRLLPEDDDNDPTRPPSSTSIASGLPLPPPSLVLFYAILIPSTFFIATSPPPYCTSTTRPHLKSRPLPPPKPSLEFSG
jgi:hypothetical protein